MNSKSLFTNDKLEATAAHLSPAQIARISKPLSDLEINNRASNVSAIFAL